MRTFLMTFWSAFLYLAAVVAPNYLIAEYGIVDVAPGPWTLMAPAAVYAVGFALVARDILHEIVGGYWVFPLIVLGSLLSVAFTDAGGRIALASGVAFLLAETLDLLIFARLRRNGWPVAALVSSLIGAGLDSLLFLWIAFGSLDFFAGQWVGKAVMIVAAVAVFGPLRRFWAPRRTANRKPLIFQMSSAPDHTEIEPGDLWLDPVTDTTKSWDGERWEIVKP